MATSLRFTADEPAGKILKEWHQGLEEDKAGRAALRRARNTTEVTFIPAYHHLLHKLLGQGLRVDRHRLALIAGLVARVESHRGGTPLAKQMSGAGRERGEPPVSELRFRRLLAIDNRGELFGPLKRIIQLLDRRIDLLSLAESVYWWGPKVRRGWAYKYYETPSSRAGEESTQ